MTRLKSVPDKITWVFLDDFRRVFNDGVVVAEEEMTLGEVQQEGDLLSVQGHPLFFPWLLSGQQRSNHIGHRNKASISNTTKTSLIMPDIYNRAQYSCFHT